MRSLGKFSRWSAYKWWFVNQKAKLFKKYKFLTEIPSLFFQHLKLQRSFRDFCFCSFLNYECWGRRLTGGCVIIGMSVSHGQVPFMRPATYFQDCILIAYNLINSRGWAKYQVPASHVGQSNEDQTYSTCVSCSNGGKIPLCLSALSPGFSNKVKIKKSNIEKA